MTTRRAPHHDTYHRPRLPWFFYYQEDSARGIDLALAEGKEWLDADTCTTAPDPTSDDPLEREHGVLIWAHGPRPLAFSVLGGFYDPGPTPEQPWPKISRRARYDQLTWAQVSRLRSRRKGKNGVRYRIRRADEMVPRALARGVKVESEAKSDHIVKAQWQALIDAIVAKGHDPADMQVKFYPKFWRSGYAAHLAHIVVIVLTHRGQRHVPGWMRRVIDFWRGRPPIWDGKR